MLNKLYVHYAQFWHGTMIYIYYHLGNSSSEESGVAPSDPTVDSNLMEYSINLPDIDFQKVSFEDTSK